MAVPSPPGNKGSHVVDGRVRNSDLKYHLLLRVQFLGISQTTPAPALRYKSTDSTVCQSVEALSFQVLQAAPGTRKRIKTSDLNNRSSGKTGVIAGELLCPKSTDSNA